MAPAQQPPIIIPAVSPPEDVKKSAAIIFMHGLGDDAFGWQGKPPSSDQSIHLLNGSRRGSTTVSGCQQASTHAVDLSQCT